MARKAAVRIKRKLFRTLSGSIAFLMFFLMYGTVGAIECDTVPLTEGMIRALVIMALWVLFTYLTQRDRADKAEARVAELGQQIAELTAGQTQEGGRKQREA